MTYFTPSTADLLPACNKVLAQELRPMHYRELTLMALDALNYDSKYVDMFRTIEDVREKLPMRKTMGVFYTGTPLCLMAKVGWFKELPLLISPDDSIVIPGSATDGCNGGFEALMRSPHMKDKWNGNVERRNEQRSKGLVLEKHVASYFETNWPDFYLEPENHRQWQQPCSHDFRLRIDSKIIRFDVAGPGEYGYNGDVKKSTDFHLLCHVDGPNVIWEGIKRGKDFVGNVIPETAISPQRLIVWLNCLKSGIDYVTLRETYKKSR